MKKIPVAQPLFCGNEKKYVEDCLNSGWISSQGSYIEKFELAFANYIQVKHAITCSNGTVALHLALLAYDVQSGDEILIPTLTYIATANAVSYCGAKPVFIDSDPKTWNLDVTQLEAKITAKTKGIIAVHLYGHPAEMDIINEIAKKHNLFVIEDAAEALGAKYNSKLTGGLGNIGIFSFFGNKIITTGEGGMLTTDDASIATRLRLLKNQGMDPQRRYWFPIIGYNYRMTNIQAAIGLAQLEMIDQHLRLRQETAQHYYHYLTPWYPYLDVPTYKEYVWHSFWMFSITLKNNASRDDLMAKLQHDGIETRPVFYPLHIMPPYFEGPSDYPVAEKIAATSLNLPTYAGLSTAQIEYICSKVGSHLSENLACVS